MQFTEEVTWSVADFLVAGILLFSAGLAFVFVSGYVSNRIYRVAVGSAIGTTLLLIWALAVVLVAVIALLTNMQQYDGSSVIEIIGVNAFFGTLFAISGLLFRYVTTQQSTKKSEA